MLQKIRGLIQKFSSEPRSQLDLINLQNQIKTLELELQERDAAIIKLSAAVSRLEAEQSAFAEQMVAAKFQKFLADLASPLTQLQVQSYLSELLIKSVRTQDVLAVTKRIDQIVISYGVEYIQQPGEIVQFQPNIHQPLSAQVELSEGQSVIVKIPGLRFQGNILLKAAVEPEAKP